MADWEESGKAGIGLTVGIDLKVGLDAVPKVLNGAFFT
jgi:hypothetical protein